jgi:hypothetical protein
MFQLAIGLCQSLSTGWRLSLLHCRRQDPVVNRATQSVGDIGESFRSGELSVSESRGATAVAQLS